MANSKQKYIDEILGQPFVISDRDLAIRREYKKYLDLTPDHVPNQVAIRFWREFKTWCRFNEYTSKDIQRAQQVVGNG